MKSDFNLTNFTDADFRKEVLNSHFPVLVIFGTDWSGSCHILDPVLEKVALAFNGKIRVGKLDVDDNSLVASMYAVNEFPTLFLIKNGEITWRYTGIISFKDLRSHLKPILQGGK